MKHITTVNGVVTYELIPEDNQDRHVIEIMKEKGKVTMRQGKQGGVIFELEPQSTVKVVVEEVLPTDLSNVPAKGKTE